MSYTQARSEDPVALPGMPSHKYVDPEIGDGSQSARGLMTSKSNKSVASNFSMKEAQDIGMLNVGSATLVLIFPLTSTLVTIRSPILGTCSVEGR
jgi:hypothetical protein